MSPEKPKPPVKQPASTAEELGLADQAAELYDNPSVIGLTFKDSILTTIALQQQQGSLTERIQQIKLQTETETDSIKQVAKQIEALNQHALKHQQKKDALLAEQEQRLAEIQAIKEQLAEQGELQTALLTPFLPQEPQPITDATERPPELRSWNQVFQMPRKKYKPFLEAYKRVLKTLAEQLPEFAKFYHPEKARNKYDFFQMLDSAYPLTIDQLNQVFNPSDKRTLPSVEKILSLVYRIYFGQFISADQFTQAAKAIRDPGKPYLKHLDPADIQDGVPLADILNIEEYKPEAARYKYTPPIPDPDAKPAKPTPTLERPGRFPTKEKNIVRLMAHSIDCLLKRMAAVNTKGIDWPIQSSMLSQISHPSLTATFIDGVIKTKKLIKPQLDQEGYPEFFLLDVIKLLSLRVFWNSPNRFAKKINRRLLGRFNPLLGRALDYFVDAKRVEDKNYQLPHWLKPGK